MSLKYRIFFSKIEINILVALCGKNKSLNKNIDLFQTVNVSQKHKFK